MIRECAPGGQRFARYSTALPPSSGTRRGHPPGMRHCDELRGYRDIALTVPPPVRTLQRKLWSSNSPLGSTRSRRSWARGMPRASGGRGSSPASGCCCSPPSTVGRTRMSKQTHREHYPTFVHPMWNSGNILRARHVKYAVPRLFSADNHYYVNYARIILHRSGLRHMITPSLTNSYP
jgi:hypothetical protein